MKKFLLVLALFTFVFTLAACGGSGDDTEECPDGQVLEGDVCVDEPLECPTGQVEENGVCVDEPLVCENGQVEENGVCVDEPACPEPLVLVWDQCLPPYEELPTDTVGQVDLMLWSGSGTYYDNIGAGDYDRDTLTAQNDAATYYVAKAFNELYPNIEINAMLHSGGPDEWAQKLIDYKNTNGVHPSLWATIDLAGDVSKGISADLSVFYNDPVYQSFIPSVMQMMNYQGVQAGLPQYILPWGIFVNKELAYSKNLEVPNYDWTIDEYTSFIANHEEDVYYGSFDTPIRILETGGNTVVKQMSEYNGTGDFVDLNSEEVQNLIEYIAEWDTHSMWGNSPSEEFFNASGGGWGYGWFQNGAVLTLEGDPWMMGDCATPDPEWWGHCTSADWDIYPRPSTDYAPNTIGIVLDPMTVYNFCLDDNDLACTEEEALKIKINYTFAKFWLAANESWLARAQGDFTDLGSGGYSSSLNDSFPVVRGDQFLEQMQMWYMPAKHQRFSDVTAMPGFHEVIRIYSEGEFWDISDKAYPFWHDYEGARRENLFEWKNYWNPDINGGVEKSDPDFVDTILGNLYQWNEDSNARFNLAYDDVKNGLIWYYGYSESDFQ